MGKIATQLETVVKWADIFSCEPDGPDALNKCVTKEWLERTHLTTSEEDAPANKLVELDVQKIKYNSAGGFSINSANPSDPTVYLYDKDVVDMNLMTPSMDIIYKSYISQGFYVEVKAGVSKTLSIQFISSAPVTQYMSFKTLEIIQLVGAQSKILTYFYKNGNGSATSLNGSMTRRSGVPTRFSSANVQMNYSGPTSPFRFTITLNNTGWQAEDEAIYIVSLDRQQGYNIAFGFNVTVTQ